MRRLAHHALACLAVLTAAVGCSGNGGTGTEVLVVSTIEISPPGASLIVGQTQQLVAIPKTSSGLSVTGRTATWSSANSAVASVSATGLVTAVAVGGPVNITATVDKVSASVAVTVSPVPVASVSVTPDQAAILIGEAVQLAATPRDAGGQPLAGRPVSWTSDNPAIATVTGTGSVIGIAVGSTAIRATSEGKVGSATIVVGPRPASRLGFVVEPQGGIAGQPMAPAIQVAVQDNIGQTVAGATTAISLILGENPGGATLGGTLTVNAVQGVATFSDLVLDKAASGYTLRASAAPLSPAVSGPFAITAAAANRLAITTQPAGTAQSGLPLSPQPVVQLRDANGNNVSQAGVSVTAALVGAGATLGGTTTVQTNATGAAVFTSLVLSGASGSYTLRFTAAGLTQAESTPIVLGAGSADRLVLTTQPSATAQSGIPFTQQPAVQLQDGSGNNVAQAGVIVTATIASGNGAVGGVVSATTNGSGRALFLDLSIAGLVGQYTLSFSAPGLSPAISGPITLSAGPAAALAMVTEPSSSATNGVPFGQQPAVRLVDGAGNPVAEAGRTVSAALAAGSGALSGGLAVTTDASGVAVFGGLTITGLVGSYQVAFGSAGLTGVTSAPIALSAGAAAGLVMAVQPSSSAQSGVPFTVQPVVQVVDQSGNPVSTAGRTITAALASGAGTLGGTLTAITAVDGRAGFTDLAVTGPSGTYTIAFSGTGLTPVTSAVIGLGAGVATQLSVDVAPSATAQSGVALAQQPVIQIRDAASNVVALAGVTVTASIASGGGTLLGTVTAVTDGSGIATFTDLAISGLVGDRTLGFSAPGLTGATSATITLSAGPAARLAITTQPSTTAQNTIAFVQQPVLQLQDAAGNPVSQAGVNVTVAIASGGGALGGTATVATSGAGVATFAGLSITGTVGPRTLGFSAAGLTGVTSNTVTLTAGPATKLAITTQPSSAAQSGVAFAQQPVIQLQDVSGNPVSQSGTAVTAAIASGGGTLGGTATVNTNASGTATFTDLSITGASGDRTLSFSAAGLTGVTSTTVTIGAGTATQLTITTQPSAAAQSGVAFPVQPVIQLRDGSSNPVAQAGVNVTAVLVTGTGTIGGTVTVPTNASGVATFTNLSISGPVGNKAIRFDAAGLTSVTSNTIVLSAGPAAKLALTVQPASLVQSGVVFPQQPVIQLQDLAGNNVATANVGVTASIATGTGATLGGGTVVLTDGTGKATFTTLALTGSSGDFTLGFASSGLTSVTSNTVTLGAGAPSVLSITTQPSPSVANGATFPQQPVIQLRDASNNPVAQAGVLVSVTILSGGPALSGTTTVATNASGAATFTDLSITGTIGDRTLIFAASGYTSITSNTVTVTPGAPAALEFQTAPPAAAQSGIALSPVPVVRLVDQSGNAVSQSGISVTAAIASGGGTLSGTNPVNTDGSGLATFTGLAINGTVGDRTLSFSSAGLTGVTSGTITLSAGTASKLAISTAPSATATSGTALAQQPAIQLQDAAGNPVSQNGVLVTATFATTPGGTPALTNATATTNAGGLATFSGLTIAGLVGGYTLQFAAPGLASVASGTITLSAGTARQLTITTQPSAAVQNTAVFPQQPAIQLRDSVGNAVSQAGVNVTAAIATGTGTLGGTATVQTNANGLATFTDLSLSGTAGDFTLQFTSGALTPVTSSTITLSAGPAASLVMYTEPSATAQSGVVFATQPVVRVQDANGNNVGSVVVTAAIATGPGGATLNGTLTATSASNGRATFTNLGITGLVGTYTLRFTASGATEVLSGNISLSAGAATKLALTTQPGSGSSGSALTTQPVIQIQDAAGNPVSQNGTLITATFGTTPGGTPGLTNATATTDAGGVATFANLTITGLIGGYTLQFNGGGLTGVTSASLTLTAGAASQIDLTTPVPAASRNRIAFATPPVARVRDGAGNPVAGVTIDAALVGAGSLGGTTSGASDAAGQVTFTNLSIASTTLGARTMNFTAGALSTPGNTTLSGGLATQLAMVTQPGTPVTSGSLLPTQPAVRLLDVDGNQTDTAATTVTAAVVEAGATLGGTTGVATSGGVATFTNLTMSGTASSYTIGFTASGLTGVTSSSVQLNAGPAATIAANSAVSQSATVNTAVAAPPSVIVRDASNNPVAGVDVTFTVTAGGGAIVPASPAVVATDVNGIATLTSWTLGTTAGAGTDTVTAAATGLTGSPVIFAASATAGTATKIAANSAVTQSATISTAVAAPPSVLVTDTYDNPVSGYDVTFTVTAGSGTTVPASPATVATNGSGIATLTSWTLGSTAGINNNAVEATAALTGSPVVFTASGTASTASQLTVTQQPAGARSGIALTTVPIVQVKDAGNNPVQGVTVNVAVVEGDALTGTTSGASDASGNVTFTGLTITGTAGSKTLRFTAAGPLSVDATPLTLGAGAAAKLAFTGTPPTTGNVAAALAPITVQLQDAQSNPLDSTGAEITAAITTDPGGTPGLTGSPVNTGAGGSATFSSLVITGLTGGYQLTFSATSLTSVTTATITLAAGVPNGVSVTTGPAATIASGELFTPVVNVTDAGGNPVPNQNVTVSLATGTGTFTGTTTAQTTGSGDATFTDIAVNGTATTGYSLLFTAGSATVTSDAFEITVGAADQLVITTEPGTTSPTSGVALVPQGVVEIRDSGGNLVSTATDVVTAALVVDTGAGGLTGTTTKAASAGVADFSGNGLTITGSGTFRISYTTSFGTVNSAPIVIP